MNHSNGPVDFLKILSFGSLSEVFARPSLWIGAAAGAAMIAGAVWFRRQRDDS
jgi:ABC-2 type transport system permease protein